MLCCCCPTLDQIIAVADFVLDMNSCFFKEDKGGTNIECSTYSSPVYDLNERKVSRRVEL